jgi:hypothetical protein
MATAVKSKQAVPLFLLLLLLQSREKDGGQRARPRTAGYQSCLRCCY